MTALHDVPGYDARPCRHVPTALFFTPDDGPQRGHVYPARAVAACAACPLSVRMACLDDALSMPEIMDQGYRAGMTQQERREVRKRRRRGAA